MIVLAAGDVERMEKLRFGYGFAYGGDGNIWRVGAWAALFWMNDPPAWAPPDPVKGVQIQLLSWP
jgi:hypothetical protein